jgi:hypothetical protein
MRIACALLAVFLLRAGPAAADLYRWVDPETGSVKFSSYPPPWYGDPARARRAPKVEHIPAGSDAAAPAGSDAVAKPEAAGAPREGARRIEVLELQRKAMLQQLSKLAPQSGAGRGAQELQQELKAYGELSDRIDALDPAGAAARRREMQPVIDRIMGGESR